uniref:PR domain zinc finger protein 15 n=1 Tax=Lygus hesperus TaxID=30085 RepID=A0A0A9WJR2_LYGHE
MKTPNPSVKTYERPVKTKASDHCCRMCLTRLRFTEMIDIFRVESEPLTNSSIIHFCTGLEISENDGLPTRMCSQCYRNLMDFFAFKRMCLASDNCLKSSRDAALKEAEIPDCSESLPEYVIKDEPQDELSLAENSDMGLLETDGFHPDAPDEVFSQIGKFELEEECSEENWRGYGIPALQRPPVPFVVEEDDSCTADEENFEEKPLENLSGTPLESIRSPAEPEPNVPSLERTVSLQTPTSDGLFPCATCLKQFRSACSLRRHKLIHIGPQHSCPHCQKQFTQKDSLKRHMVTHMDRRFVCAECSKVLMSREGLKCHIRTHHTDRSQTSNYFKYKCQECNKRFAHASGLSRHAAIHRGVKHECNICSKKFNDSSQLKRHTKSHLKDSNGSSREVNVKKKSSDSRITYSPSDVPSVSVRLPTSQLVNYRVDTRGETSDSECHVLDSNEDADKLSSKDVVPKVPYDRQESRTTSNGKKVIKLPYNSKLYGEERRKYVVLQAL